MENFKMSHTKAGGHNWYDWLTLFFSSKTQERIIPGKKRTRKMSKSYLVSIDTWKNHDGLWTICMKKAGSKRKLMHLCKLYSIVLVISLLQWTVTTRNATYRWKNLLRFRISESEWMTIMAKSMSVGRQAGS